MTLEMKGPVAYRLLQVFLERWRDSADAARFEKEMGLTTEIGKSKEKLSIKGGIPAQVLITAGDMKDRKKADPNDKPYNFAPSGEMSFRKALVHALRNTKEGVYLQDQYGWGMFGEVKSTISAVLKERSVDFTVITPEQPTIEDFTFEDAFKLGFMTSRWAGVAGEKADSNAWAALAGTLRFAGGLTVESVKHMQDFKFAQDYFWVNVASQVGDRLKIYHTDKDKHFIHSKLWIFDRKFAFVGSANFNVRSFTHDSEVMIAFYDPLNLSAKQDELYALHVPPSLRTPHSIRPDKPTDYNANTVRYQLPKVLYDNFQGVGKALGAIPFFTQIDPNGGPENAAQLEIPGPSKLNAEIEAAMRADLDYR